MKSLFTTAALVALFITACGKDTGTGGQPVAEPTYKWLNTNVIGPKCLECHGAGKKIPFVTYEQVAKYVIAGKGAASPLYQVLLPTAPKQMPLNRPALAQTEADAFKAWIDAGASAQ